MANAIVARSNVSTDSYNRMHIDIFESVKVSEFRVYSTNKSKV